MTSANTKPENRPMGASRYPCLCALTRKAGRILTKEYDKYLKSSGLKTTQYSMLVNIARNPAITVSELAGLLAMDQTTVSRNLRVLQKTGYIQLERGVVDQRIKRIQISDTGMSKINEARPLWDIAQLSIERVLGRASIEGLLSTLKKMAG